jgi:hypothetical protein
MVLVIVPFVKTAAVEAQWLSTIWSMRVELDCTTGKGDWATRKPLGCHAATLPKLKSASIHLAMLDFHQSSCVFFFLIFFLNHFSLNVIFFYFFITLNELYP